MEKEIQSVKTTKGVLDYYRDWEHCEGGICMLNPQTINRYHELRAEQSNVNVHKYDVFFAFSNTQFVEGLKRIRPLEEGERLVSIGGGGYGTRDGVKRLFEFYEEVDTKIKAECDPQEVYFYEYNNHESMIGWDGDTEAIKIVVALWGEDVARNIERYDATMSVDNLFRKPVKVAGLYFMYNGEKRQPSSVWFSDVESEVSNKGVCHSMFDNVLYSVFTPDGEVYKNAELAGLSANYDGESIYDYRK